MTGRRARLVTLAEVQARIAEVRAELGELKNPSPENERPYLDECSALRAAENALQRQAIVDKAASDKASAKKHPHNPKTGV